MAIDKSFMVFQSNDFIVNKKHEFELSLYEQKLISTIISTVKPDDENFNTITFKTTDLADLLELEYDYMYKTLPEITARLRSRTLSIMTETGLRQMGIVDVVEYNVRQGSVNLQLGEYIKPYLLRLKSFFIQYKLEYVLKLNSEYAFSLYELIKTEQFKHKAIFTIDKLKQVLVANKKSYNAYCHFKARILEPARKEISKKTDVIIEYKEIKDSRKVVAIEFTITNKIVSNKKENIINKNNLSEQSKLIEFLKLPTFSNSMKNKVKDWDMDRLKRSIKKFEGYKTDKVKRFALLEKIYNEDNNFINKQPLQEKGKNLKFKNFDERTYDYDDLEQRLLGWK